MKIERSGWWWTQGLVVGLALGGLACRQDDGGDSDGINTRYEPTERVDFDNVSVLSADGAFQAQDTGRGGRAGGMVRVPYKGGMPEMLDLPEPPRSGFRLVLPRLTLEPFQEINFPLCLPIPDTANRFIYSSVLYSTPGLHHGNMLAMPRPTGESRNYPECIEGDAFAGLGALGLAVMTGGWSTYEPPEVLFANSTQNVGVDRYSQPAGYGTLIGPTRDMVMDTHLLNPSGEMITLELVYDFYTMPEDRVEHRTTPFVWMWIDFTLPAQTEKTLSASCDWGGYDLDSDIVTIMPHMHEWGTRYEVDLVYDAVERRNVYDKRNVNSVLEGDVESYDPPVDAGGARDLEFSCHFLNDLDHDMGMGIGENEMCFLFGFVSPPEASTVGTIVTEETPCLSFNVGRPELLGNRSALTEILTEWTPEQQERALSIIGRFIDR